VLCTAVAVCQAAGSLLGERTVLACPGDEAHYVCAPEMGDYITWNIKCDQQGIFFTPTVSESQSLINVAQNCTSSSSEERVSFTMLMTYASNVSMAWSSLNITVPARNYSVSDLYSLRIDCEDTRDYRYLNVTGNDV
jgi:hypothetical protein